MGRGVEREKEVEAGMRKAVREGGLLGKVNEEFDLIFTKSFFLFLPKL